MEDYIRNTFPNNELIIPQVLGDIPKNEPLVYILTYNNAPIIVGVGKKDQASVIFHELNYYPRAHKKAISVRLHLIYGEVKLLKRYIIVCDDQPQANRIEKKIHRDKGGRGLNIPEGIRDQLFRGIPIESNSYILLNIALLSSYDALDDLLKWRKHRFVDDDTWGIISDRLKLNEIQ